MDWPEFRDPSGGVWIWDSESHTYVMKPSAGLPEPDRGHATGGDNDLFNQNQIEHSELPGVPELEGHMAAMATKVRCVNCDAETTEKSCPTCGKDLTPEWNRSTDKNQEWMDSQPPHSDASEYTSLPERVPKRNRQKTDDSYPSMLSSVDWAFKIASRKMSQDDWDNYFDLPDWDDPNAAPGKVEIGKWLQDRNGGFHYEHGMSGEGGVNHEPLAERHGVEWPNGVGALGSVYNDGTADTARVFPGHNYNHEATSNQVQQAFGPVNHFPPSSMWQAPEEEVGEITGGSWLARDHVSGVAWVKERPNGEYSPEMILCAEHLQPDDYQLYSQGAKAIVTAYGGLSSHAAMLASTMGIPTVVGVGEDYMKIQSGSHLTIDPATKTITVLPEVSSAQDPATKRQRGEQIYDYYRQRDPYVNQKQPKPTFAHAIEEEEWRLANSPNLDSCPECGDPMVDKGDKKVCHGCGHKQQIITASVREAFLPLLLPLLEGAGAAAAGGEAAGGLLEGAGGLGQIGNLMGGAMSPGRQQAQPEQDGAEVRQAALGDDNTGLATDNRGENSDPEHDGSGDSFKEKGDSPELLKDVGGGPKSPHGDVDMQEKALKAFKLNEPLIIEFANSDLSGADHPILKALDELLEGAFPGYKDGNEPAQAEEKSSEDALDDFEKDVETPPDEDKPPAKPKEASVWDFLSYDTGMGVGMNPGLGQTPGMDPSMMPGGAVPCAKCGLPHDPSLPCPVGQNDIQAPATGQGINNPTPQMQMGTPPVPQKVITKTAMGEPNGLPGQGLSDPRIPNQMQSVKPTEGLEYYTPDEVAETLPVSQETGLKLWQLLGELEQNNQAAPMGGEGHDPYGENGPATVEDPYSRRDVVSEGRGNMVSIWDKLTPQEQTEINQAYEKEFADWGTPTKDPADPFSSMEDHFGGFDDVLPGREEAMFNAEHGHRMNPRFCVGCQMQQAGPGDTYCPGCRSALENGSDVADWPPVDPATPGWGDVRPPARQNMIGTAEPGRYPIHRPSHVKTAAPTLVCEECGTEFKGEDDDNFVAKGDCPKCGHYNRHEEGHYDTPSKLGNYDDLGTPWGDAMHPDMSAPSPHCKNCGLAHPADAQQCPNCGAPADYDPARDDIQQSPMPPTDPNQGEQWNRYREDRDYFSNVDDHFGLFDKPKEHEHHHEESHDADTDGDWQDDSGQPLVEGADYDLRMGSQAVPDRVTILAVLPNKVSVMIHTGDVDYQHEITKQELHTEGYTFAQAQDGSDSMGDNLEMAPPEAPVRPGQDALPQVTDLSDTDTKVSGLNEYSGSFQGDNPDSRNWLNEGSAVEVDPVLMAKLAGKDYSPREQRDFIDEEGTARNLDKLQLEGTHYIVDDDLDTSFNW